jgi:exonuclease VII large subunit
MQSAPQAIPAMIEVSFGRVRARGLDLGRRRVDLDSLADQLGQPGPFGQRQQRRQPREGHKIGLIKPRSGAEPHIG